MKTLLLLALVGQLNPGPEVTFRSDYGDVPGVVAWEDTGAFYKALDARDWPAVQAMYAAGKVRVFPSGVKGKTGVHRTAKGGLDTMLVLVSVNVKAAGEDGYSTAPCWVPWAYDSTRKPGLMLGSKFPETPLPVFLKSKDKLVLLAPNPKP